MPAEDSTLRVDGAGSPTAYIPALLPIQNSRQVTHYNAGRRSRPSGCRRVAIPASILILLQRWIQLKFRVHGSCSGLHWQNYACYLEDLGRDSDLCWHCVRADFVLHISWVYELRWCCCKGAMPSIIAVFTGGYMRISVQGCSWCASSTVFGSSGVCIEAAQQCPADDPYYYGNAYNVSH